MRYTSIEQIGAVSITRSVEFSPSVTAELLIALDIIAGWSSDGTDPDLPVPPYLGEENPTREEVNSDGSS